MRLKKFFTHTSEDIGIAFVIILHLDPEHKGRVGELIQHYTPMPVVEAIAGGSGRSRYSLSYSSK